MLDVDPNPPLAQRALKAERDIGMVPPCNVVERAEGPDTTLVQALDPEVMARVSGPAELTEVADDAARRLRGALATSSDERVGRLAGRYRLM